jgi:hypothetical protein
VLLLAALTGLVVGFGIGFRSDLLVCVPAAVFCIAAFLPGEFRRTWKLRLAAAALFFAVFLLPSWPILRAMRNGGANSAHVSLLGFTAPFDKALGIDSPFYAWGYSYNDTHVISLIDMYSNWSAGNTKPLGEGTAEYDRYGREYLIRIVRHFPADMLTRAYGAIMRVLDLPVSGMPNHLYLDPNQQPIGIANPSMLSHYLRWHGLLVHYAHGLPALCAIATLLLLAARSIRQALFLAFVIGYFGAYAILQFSLRHVFHLEIIGLWVMAFVASALWWLARAIYRRRRGEVIDDAQFAGWRRSLVFGLALFAVTVVVLQVVRRYQDSHIHDLLPQYAGAPMERLSYHTEPGSSTDRLLLRLDGVGSSATIEPGTMRFDYIVLQLREDHPVSLVLFRQKPIASPVWNTTEQVDIPMPAALTNSYPTDVSKFFFAAYTGPESSFEGIEVPMNTLQSLEGVYRIDPSANLPLLLWMTLRPDWERRPAHQRLIGPELRHTALAFHDTPPAVVRRSPDVVMTADDLATTGPLAAPHGQAIDVKGIVSAANADFFHYKPHHAARGSAFVLEGSMRYGCVTAIVMTQGQFIPVTVHNPGPFRIVTAVPVEGDYTVVVANTECNGPNDFTVTRAGWIENTRTP